MSFVPRHENLNSTEFGDFNFYWGEDLEHRVVEPQLKHQISIQRASDSKDKTQVAIGNRNLLKSFHLALKLLQQKASKSEDLVKLGALSKEARRLYNLVQIFELGVIGILVGESSHISACLESNTTSMDYLWSELRALHQKLFFKMLL